MCSRADWRSSSFSCAFCDSSDCFSWPSSPLASVCSCSCSVAWSSAIPSPSRGGSPDCVPVAALVYAPCEMVSGVPEAAGMAYREAGDAAAPPGLFVRGCPESSFVWREALAAVAGARWRGVAPDLPGYGDSPPGDRPGTWEEHVSSLERFRSALGIDRVVLCPHDGGVLIGLRWACDQTGAARALVISDGGFFADRRWHDFANTLRTPGEGEAAIKAARRRPFGPLLG